MRRVLAFMLRRLAVSLVIVWLMTVVVWGVFFLLPADPTRFILREQVPSEQRREQAREILGLDEPIPVQYGKWLWGALRGDFGISWASAAPDIAPEDKVHVTPMVVDAAAVTGSLALGGAAVLVLLAIPLGTFLATRPHSILDRLSTTAAIGVIAMPPLVVGLLLQTFVANKWGLVPGGGYCNLRGAPPPDPDIPAGLGGPPPCGGLREWTTHLILPWITFALFFLALYVRMTRSFVLDVLDEPFVQTARAKGASELRVVRAHALRNALVPLVTMLAMDLGTALGVAIYVETVFGLPGLGRTLLFSLPQQASIDRPVMTGLVVFTTLVIVTLNFLADTTYAVLDPRISPTTSARARLVPAMRVG